jgi:hypothetical protein
LARCGVCGLSESWRSERDADEDEDGKHNFLDLTGNKDHFVHPKYNTEKLGMSSNATAILSELPVREAAATSIVK